MYNITEKTDQSEDTVWAALGDSRNEELALNLGGMGCKPALSLHLTNHRASHFLFLVSRAKDDGKSLPSVRPSFSVRSSWL